MKSHLSGIIHLSIYATTKVGKHSLRSLLCLLVACSVSLFQPVSIYPSFIFYPLSFPSSIIAPLIIYPLSLALVDFRAGFKKEEDLRRSPRSLQKSTLANVALNILSLLINLQLRLCRLGFIIFAVALRCCFRSLLFCYVVSFQSSYPLFPILSVPEFCRQEWGGAGLTFPMFAVL